jgi:hypothetical protein
LNSGWIGASVSRRSEAVDVLWDRSRKQTFKLKMSEENRRVILGSQDKALNRCIEMSFVNS